MQKRAMFTGLPRIECDTIMSQTLFWHYLMLNALTLSRKVNLVATIKAFGGVYSFDIIKHVLPADQVNNYKHTFEYWCFLELPRFYKPPIYFK